MDRKWEAHITKHCSGQAAYGGVSEKRQKQVQVKMEPVQMQKSSFFLAGNTAN